MLICNTVDVYSPELDFFSTALLGNPTAPTPQQFDNDTSIATTAFVQRALGSYSGQVGVVTSRALTLDLAGQIINCANSIIVTLPVGSVEAVGATFQINNAGSGIVTVQAAAGQNLYGVGNATARTFALGAGDTVTIAYVGGNSWYGWGGIQLGSSASFGSLLQANGYQKLPSGLILQWVVGSCDANGNMQLTLPIQFPNGPIGGIANEAAPGGWTASGDVTVWAYDQGNSTKSTVLGRARRIYNSGPVPAVGVSGRIFVWGY